MTIRPDARGGQVHYTVDGSDPVATSPIYREPFRVDENVTVRALTFDAQDHSVGFEDRVSFEKVDKIKHQSWLASLLAGKFVPSNKPSAKESEVEPRVFDWAEMKLVTISDFPDYIDASGGQPTGVFVESLAKDSPALKAGVKEGDTIIRVNSTEVRQLEDLERALKKAKGEFNMKVFRNYQHRNLKLSL